MPLDEATLNSAREEIKHIALSVIELRLSEGISQSDIHIKFHSNLMQRFSVDLKTFLGLAMLPCCHKVNIWLVCRWDFWASNLKPS